MSRLTGIFRLILGRGSKEGPVRSSVELAGELLAVARRKETGGNKSVRAHPLLFLVLNLFFCGYYHQFLRRDSDGHFLTLFVLIEATLIAIFTVGSLVQHAREVIQKSIIFPTTPSGRLLFAVVSCLRQPLVSGSWFSAGLFFAVVFRGQGNVPLASIGAFTLMTLDIVLVASVFFLFGLHARNIVSTAMMILATLAGMALIAATVFRFDSFVVKWASSEVAPAGNAAVPAMLVNGAVLMAIFFGGVIVGRRIS